MALFWAHRREEATRFLKNYEKIFTTRSDGKGWHHHISMVLLAFAFIASLRAGWMQKDEKRPSFPSRVRMIVPEVATQELMNKRRMPRKDARPTAELMLREYSDW